MRCKPKSIAALQLALDGLPKQMRVEVDTGHRNIGKDRRRVSHGDGVARKFGDYDAAGPLSRERGKGEQS
jgi:hypothetical protein